LYTAQRFLRGSLALYYKIAEAQKNPQTAKSAHEWLFYNKNKAV